MYYSYEEIEYIAMGFSPARTDLALKLLRAILICYSQFHQAKRYFFERSCSPLSINVSNFLFHISANLKKIRKLPLPWPMNAP
jgi:hypothetical protein